MSLSLQEAFSSLEDPRIERHKRHQLLDIIVLTICAVVSGAEGREAIEAFGKEKQDWLRQWIALENGIPSHDCIARLMSRLPAEEVSACFSRWVQSVARLTEGEVVAIDGKTARRSFDQEDKMGAIHMVSAWASQTGLSLGQVKTQEKSNEITAIPRLLAMLEIKGCIVTIDAMGCQEKIAGKIVEKGADYALAVKGNQKSLHEAIVDYFAVAVDGGVEDGQALLGHHEQVDVGHGRIEQRRYYLADCLDTLPSPRRWQGLKALAWWRVNARSANDKPLSVATTSPRLIVLKPSPTLCAPTGAWRTACIGYWMSRFVKTSHEFARANHRATSISSANWRSIGSSANRRA